MEHAEEVVVVAGKHVQLMVWNRLSVEPHQDPMLRHHRRRNEAAQSGDGPAHIRSRAAMQPPVPAFALVPSDVTNWFHYPANVFKGHLVKRRLLRARIASEVDNPHVSGTTSDVQSIDIGTHDIAVGVAIRVQWCREHLSGCQVIDVEGAALLVTAEADADVLKQGFGSSQVRLACEIAVDPGHRGAIKLPVLLGAIVEANHRYVHCRPAEYPVAIRACPEDV